MYPSYHPNVTNIDFIDHYFDLLTYLADRKRRLESFRASHPLPAEGKYTNPRSATAWKDYCGRERANLRKRRTKTKCNDFSILSQIGQGGYGQVFLARKRDTAEIVALKKMNVYPHYERFNGRKDYCIRWTRFDISLLKGIFLLEVEELEDGWFNCYMHSKMRRAFILLWYKSLKAWLTARNMSLEEISEP
jgi:serine/threonine protein kinase